MNWKLQIQAYSFSEWKIMRVLFSIFWLERIAYILYAYASIPVPRGWAQFIDLSLLTTLPGKVIVIMASIICVVVYIRNKKMVLVTGIMFLIGLGVHTYQDSQALDMYNEIINLLVLGQFIAFVQEAIASRRDGKAETMADDEVKNRAIHYSKQAIIACYLVAGISKLSDAGLSWVVDAPNLSLVVYKSHMHAYIGWLLPEMKASGLYFSSLIADNPFLIQIAFALTLLLESLGIFALTSRKASVFVGTWYVVFHLSVAYITGIRFDQFVVVVIIFMINIAYPMIKVQGLFAKRFQTTS